MIDSFLTNKTITWKRVEDDYEHPLSEAAQTVEDSTLPKIIKIVQTAKSGAIDSSFDFLKANKAGELGGYIRKNDLDKNDLNIGGIVGFSIDCKHKYLNPTKGANAGACLESDYFKELNDIFSTYSSPSISRQFLLDRFVIIEIPDFSHQALSNGYTDFVPYVYDGGGHKIPQRYVGLIKAYHNKTAYILLDKANVTYNSGYNSGPIATTNESYNSPKNDYTFSVVIKYKKNYEKINSTAISGTPDYLEFTNKYDYTLFNSNKINLNNENYLYPNFLKEDEIKLKVRRQSDKIENLSDPDLDIDNYGKDSQFDYFSTIFEMDYDIDPINPKVIKGEGTASPIQPTKISDINEIKYYYSRQEGYEFIETANFDGYYNFTFPEEFNVFNRKTGEILYPNEDYSYTFDNERKRITGISWEVNGANLSGNEYAQNFEVIPEFSSGRKIRICGKKCIESIALTEDWIRSILKYLRFFRYDKCVINNNTTRIYINHKLVRLGNNVNVIADDTFLIIIDDDLENSVDKTNFSYTDPEIELKNEISGRYLYQYTDYLNPFNSVYSENVAQNDTIQNSVSRKILPNDLKRIYKNDYSAAIRYELNDRNRTEIELKRYISPENDNGSLLGDGNSYRDRMSLIRDELYNDHITLKQTIDKLFIKLSQNFYKILKNSKVTYSPYIPHTTVNTKSNTIFIAIRANNTVETITMDLLENNKNIGNPIKISRISSDDNFSYFIIPPFWKFQNSDSTLSKNLNNLSIQIWESGCVYYLFGNGGN